MTASVSHHAIALMFGAIVRVLKPRAPGRTAPVFTTGLAHLQRFFLPVEKS